MLKPLTRYQQRFRHFVTRTLTIILRILSPFERMLYMDNDFTFLVQLNPKQRDVCISENNYVLTACPGSGKTRTITYRLAYLDKKYIPSRLLNIAITYTNRAADEIYSRLDSMSIDESSIWTGTIHQFCMHFIIRPYAMYSEQLCHGYHIVDEFIKKQYLAEINSALRIHATQSDLFSNPIIKAAYRERLRSNKEIDFDMILELSDTLLSEHPFIAENTSFQNISKTFQVLSRLIRLIYT